MFRQRILDTNLILKTKGTVLSSAMATKGTVWNGGLGATVTLDVGTGFTQGAFVVQVATPTEAGLAAGAQYCKIQLRGGTTKAFIREVPLATVEISMSSIGATRRGVGTAIATLTTTTHEYVVPFCNEYDGTIYQYLRCYHVFLGTWTTGINYSAWVTKF